LNKGEVFISPLDLNIEYHEIEYPLKPMNHRATGNTKVSMDREVKL